MDVPCPENRPSINEVVTEIQKQEWYKDQIADRRTFTAREAREGACSFRHIYQGNLTIE